MWTYISYDELYHHGTLGMKWGVRRYQNKDGSLTSAGKKKRAASKKAAKVLTKKGSIKNQKKPESKETVASKKKVSEMSDDEIRKAIARKTLENDYNRLYPQRISRGKKFVKSVMEKVVAPAATEAGKKLLSNFLETEGRKMLGLSPAQEQKSGKKK